jgi:hypothetical protein
MNTGKYTAWGKWRGGGWQPVAEGPDLAAAHRELLARIRERGRVPTSSAVLPAGAHPETSRQVRGEG